MDDQRKQVASIIHTHAVAASGLATLMAQAVPLNVGVSTALLTHMFAKLTQTVRKDRDNLEEMSSAVISLVFSWLAVSFMTRSVVGLVPVIGNVANGAITFATFEAVGWGMYELLKSGRDPRTMTTEDFKVLVEQGKRNKIDIKAAIKRMPKRVKAEYDELNHQFGAAELDEARDRIQYQINQLLDPYID